MKLFCMDPEKVLEDLEKEVEDAEHDFERVRDSNAEGSEKDRQERVESLLSKVHEQIRLLHSIAEKDSGKE